MTITELAWAAGIIDGEGCILVRRTKRPGGGSPIFTLIVSVNMTHRPTVARLAEIFHCGGCWANPPRGARRRPMYLWTICTKNARAILRRIRPYLVTKAHQADLAEAFSALPVWRGRPRGGIPAALVRERERLYALMRAAKRV